MFLWSRAGNWCAATRALLCRSLVIFRPQIKICPVFCSRRACKSPPRRRAMSSLYVGSASCRLKISTHGVSLHPSPTKCESHGGRVSATYFRKRHHVLSCATPAESTFPRYVDHVRPDRAFVIISEIRRARFSAAARNYNAAFSRAARPIILFSNPARDGGFSQLTAATNNNVLILQHRAAPPPPTSVKNGDESQFRRHISPSHVARKAKRAIAKILQREILFSQIAFCILSVAAFFPPLQKN